MSNLWRFKKLLMPKLYPYLTLLLSLLIISGCDKTPEDDIIDPVDGGRLYVCNEGNFQQANSSLSRFSLEDGSVVNNYYQSVNDETLGDIFQSMSFHNDNAYLVVNNSGKVIVADTDSMKHIHTFSGLTSPRYVLPINDSKAYVSDLFGGIHILDLSNNTVSGNITLPGWTEEMALVNNKVYVCNPNTSQLYIINPQTDQVSDSVEVGFGPTSLVQDKDGHLWVLCSSYQARLDKGIFQVDTQIDEFAKSLFFTDSADVASALRINSTKDSIYYLFKGGVKKMSITADDLPSDYFITPDNGALYGLAVDPQEGTVYTSDALDYVQSGIIRRYTAKGTLIDQFNAGIIPGNMYLVR